MNSKKIYACIVPSGWGCLQFNSTELFYVELIVQRKWMSHVLFIKRSEN